MATGRARKRVGYGLDVKFTSEEEKTAFIERLEDIRKLLTPPGRRHLENRELLGELFSCAERRGLAVQQGMGEAHHGHQAMGDSPTIPSPKTGTFLGNAGTYIIIT